MRESVRKRKIEETGQKGNKIKRDEERESKGQTTKQEGKQTDRQAEI